MKKIALGIILTLGLGFSSAHADDLLSPLLLQESSKATGKAIASSKLAERDWSAAETELVNTEFSPEDQIFAKVNLAFLYSVTGRTEKAMALYQEILDGRDNSFAMTLSGKPRKVKYIAKDGLKRLETL